jgi:hypothetical protein
MAKKAKRKTKSKSAAKGVRRVVTTHDRKGQAIVMSDSMSKMGEGQPELGVESYLMWVTDETPAEMTGKKDHGKRKIGIPPPPNGSICRIVDFHPQSKAQKNVDPEFMAKLIGGGHGKGGKPSRHPGMHRTRSIDYIIVLDGEIDMLLDKGEVHLKAGDVVVQRGTNHAWVNRGKKTCRIAAILIDGKEV